MADHTWWDETTTRRIYSLPSPTNWVEVAKVLNTIRLDDDLTNGDYDDRVIVEAWDDEAARRAAYDAETERLRPEAEARMAALRLRLAQLDRPVRADAAVVNVPLSRRMPTDEQIAEIVALDARLRRLEARFGGAR